MSSSLSFGVGTVLSFLGVVALIPVALWLLKRTPMGAPGPVRVVASQIVGPQQRVLTLEVGAGEARQWLIVGVSAAGMQTLHTMVPTSVGDEPTRPLVMPNSFAAHWARHRQGPASIHMARAGEALP